MNYLISFAAIILAVYYYRKISICRGRIVRLIYFELIYNLIIKYLIGNIGLPSAFNYVTDLVLIWIFLEYLHQRNEHKHVIPKSLVLCAMLLWIVSILSYIFNIYSPLLYLWGFRNNFRFIIYAMMCATYLRKSDVNNILDILFGFFCLNIFVVTYQFFFTSYSQVSIGDFISGLFSNGSERGGNASLNWLMCILCTYAIVEYLNKKGNIKKVIVILTGSLYMASIAEIKLFFIQLIIIVVLAIAICKKSLKILVLSMVGVAGLYTALKLLYYAFPGFTEFFTYENILTYVTRSRGYSSNIYSTGVDRLTVFSYVFSNFLKTLPDRLLGIGLGNADFSSYPFLTSSFYNRYGWSGYVFFSSSFVLIEMGIIGLIAYFLYFANYIWFSLKKYLFSAHINIKEKNVYSATIILGLICFIMIFSNQTLKIEASAYMVNMLLSMPFIVSRDND